MPEEHGDGKDSSSKSALRDRVDDKGLEARANQDFCTSRTERVAGQPVHMSHRRDLGRGLRRVKLDGRSVSAAMAKRLRELKDGGDRARAVRRRRG